MCTLLGNTRTAVAQVWGEIELPGGVIAAREVLGLGTETRTSSAFLIDFVRTFHQVGGGDSVAVETFQRYLSHIQLLRSSLAAWPNGLLLGTTALRDQDKDRWRDLAELLALRLREVKNRPVLEPARGDDAAVRVNWLKALGIDPATVAQQLNQGERVRLAIPSDVLPLPIPQIWPAVLRQSSEPPDIVQLGATHVPALLYVGLMAMDEETLTYIAAHPDILDMGEAESGAFAAFGRSIRIRNSRIEAAGGAPFAPIWAEIVDRRLDEPDEFIRRLLGRDEGRLAFLYDTVAHVSGAVQSALLDGTRRVEDRREMVDRHYRWFRDVDPPWKVGTRPFYRPQFDPSLALRLLDIPADGTVGAPGWPQILERITDDDDWPDEPVRDLEDGRASLEWAMRWMFDSKDGQRRFLLLRFAQRRFARAPRAAAPQIEIALRGFDRMPALLLAMERMGVEDPAVFAELSEAAYRLTMVGDVQRVEPVLRQWQAALSIFEQVIRRRPIPPGTRDDLLRTLAKAAPEDASKATGNIGAWVLDTLNPGLSANASPGADYEAETIAAWLDSESQPHQSLTWEGLDYRIDRIGPVSRDAAAIRGSAKGPALGHLELLRRTRREIEKGLTTLEQAKELASRLQTVSKALSEIRDERDKAVYDTGDLEGSARALSRLRRPRDLNRAARQLPTVRAAMDTVAGHVLPALAYALAAAPNPQPQLFSDLALRHQLTMSEERPPGAWRVSAWTLPNMAPVSSGGTGAQGSLLALDIALADAQLRRVAVTDSSLPPIESTFNPADKDAFVSRLAVAVPAVNVEPEAKAVIAALAGGTRRLSQLAQLSSGPDVQAVREALLAASVGDVRANLLLWMWRRGDIEAAEELALPSDRFTLGAEMSLPLLVGVFSAPFDGCLCLRQRDRRAVDEWAGRGASGHLSVLVADLQLRLTQALAESRLPVSLMELLLPMAIQDTIDRTEQFSPEDWEALTVSRFMPRERVDDYLLALIAEGILAPPLASQDGPGGQ